jgi:aldose 1-epimerase
MMANLVQAAYGRLPDGRPVELYTLTNANGLRVRLTNFGALTVSVETPDRAGRLADITLGCDTLAGWLADGSYFGATVGRYANRIARGRFTLDGRTCTLATNNGPNALHGGLIGFNKVLWTATPESGPGRAGVRFTYLSPDGEEGYPGNLHVTALYSLGADNAFTAEFSATTDQPTVVNLAHHTYWNLGGLPGDILGHELLLAADHYTVVDDGLIPTGEIRPVAGTPLDFTTPTPIGARLAQVPGGYDHNYVLRNQSGRVEFVARVREPRSGRVLELHSDQPGVQFYSGNFLGGGAAGNAGAQKGTGKGGVAYARHAGLCLETQHYPDSPNHPAFPSTVLRPGETYRHVMIHKFTTAQ